MNRYGRKSREISHEIVGFSYRLSRNFKFMTPSSKVFMCNGVHYAAFKIKSRKGFGNDGSNTELVKAGRQKIGGHSLSMIKP